MKCFFDSHTCEGELLKAPTPPRGAPGHFDPTWYCEAHMHGCRGRSVLSGKGLSLNNQGRRMFAARSVYYARSEHPGSPSENWDAGSA